MAITPYPLATRTLKAKTSATTTSLAFGPGTVGSGGVRLYCTTNTCMYAFGRAADGAVTATVSCVPIPAGIIEYVDVGNADTVAIFNPIGSATLYITPIMGGGE